MSVIYLECAMGAAGDMLTAALLELHHNPEDFINRFNNCGIPGVKMCIEKSVKCGISGTHVKMLLDGKKTFNQLIKEIHVEDLEEQIATLVESGLISNDPDAKEFYVLTPSLNGNRNYAKRFTSAENMAMMQMKDMDRRKAIECAIIRCIKKKKNGAEGSLWKKKIARICPLVCLIQE